MQRDDHAVVPGAPPDLLGPWRGDGLYARSVRFALMLLAPVGIGILGRGDQWIAYALLPCLLGFAIDPGGPPLRRLMPFLLAGLVILAGGLLGTMVASSAAGIALALGISGVLYGLAEGSHPNAASAARFLCLGVIIAAFFAPLRPFDVFVVGAFSLYSWLVSIAYDAASGFVRPDAAPSLAKIGADLRSMDWPRWSFAAICGVFIAGAYLLARAFGLDHPDWAIFALLISLHANAQLSRRLALYLLLGTVLGVAVATLYAALLPYPAALLLGMMLMALIRWPAQQRHGVLGIAVMAAFVILLLQLVADLTGAPSRAPLDRILDIALGCGLSIAALWLNGKVQAALRHKADGA